jgi:hypothetical protein
MKKLFKAICPPIIWSMLQKLKHKKTFFGTYQTFDQVLDEKPWGLKSWEQLMRDKMNTVPSPVNTVDKFIPDPPLERLCLHTLPDS